MEKFKIFLDKNKQINLKLEGQEFKISRIAASAMIYELYRIIEIQEQLIAMDWKALKVENMDEIF